MTDNLRNKQFFGVLLFALSFLSSPETEAQEIIKRTYTYKTVGDLQIHAEAYEAVGTRVISEDPEANRWRFYLYTRQQGVWPLEVAGYDPDSEPEEFDPYCPVRNITKDYPPTLLLHGDADTDVPFNQSVTMAKELERHEVQHEFIALAGQGHGFDNAMQDPAIAKTFNSVLAFLEKQLK